MSDTSPIIYVVDDDLSFLPAMSRLLRAVGYAVRAFGSPTEFLNALPLDGFGCVILDLQMPGLSGFDLQAALARTDSTLPVIFLTGYGDVPAAVRAMRQGAEDFLSKRAAKEVLFGAIERAVAQDAKAHAHRAWRREVRGRFAALTLREREVLEHVVRGQLNKQIAADLAITERTVKLHRTAITTKLKVQSVAELVRLVQDAELLREILTPH